MFRKVKYKKEELEILKKWNIISDYDVEKQAIKPTFELHQTIKELLVSDRILDDLSHPIVATKLTLLLRKGIDGDLAMSQILSEYIAANIVTRKTKDYSTEKLDLVSPIVFSHLTNFLGILDNSPKERTNKKKKQYKVEIE